MATNHHTDKNETIITLVQKSIRNNWEEMAMTDFHGVAFQYRDVARKIAKLHILFEKAGIKPGDKIAFAAKTALTSYSLPLAALTYGAVSVPILHEFKPRNIHHLVNHLRLGC